MVHGKKGRFDPDTQNGHIYSSIKEEEVFIYWGLLFLEEFSKAGSV